jgi:hypothetical protein
LESDQCGFQSGLDAKRASAHFGIDKQGSIWQFVDTDDRAWAIDGGTNDSHWISVENVAKLAEQLTEGQLFGCALILEWLHDNHDVPFALARNSAERGLGYHRMFHWRPRLSRCSGS